MIKGKMDSAINIEEKFFERCKWMEGLTKKKLKKLKPITKEQIAFYTYADKNIDRLLKKK